MSKYSHFNSSSHIKRWLHRFGWAIVVILLLLIGMLIGYFLGFNQAEEELMREREQTQQLINQIKALAQVEEGAPPSAKPGLSEQDREIQKLKKELQEMLMREHARQMLTPQHEYAPKDKKAPPPPTEPRPVRPTGSEAKLTIIIDDVSYAHDVKAIQTVGLPLVMSFLPPSVAHPDSANLAAKEKGCMVHLPMEAVDYSAEEPMTLRICDTEETIAKQIAAIKRLYPNVRYINNHTGSKFTADYPAMERLIKVLKNEGIVFVDSRTTAQTKVRQAGEKYGLPYLGRDVFLDHEDGVANVKKQIRKAVDMAKKHGSAIAIGHPRKDTIQALKESKELLGQVRLVGIDQI